MYEQSNVTVYEVMKMMQNLTLRHGLSNTARDDIINCIKLCTGDAFKYLNITNNQMMSLSNEERETLTLYYECTKCYTVLLFCKKKRF